MSSKLSSGKKISTRDIPIESAKDFLAVAHAIGLGAADGLSSEFEFLIDYDDSPREERSGGGGGGSAVRGGSISISSGRSNV